MYTSTAAILYFFGYKTEHFSFQNNSKNLDLSYKTDLDLWEFLGRVKHIAKFHSTNLVICTIKILNIGTCMSEQTV